MAAEIVTFPYILHFDDFRTEVREAHGAVRPVDDAAKIDHADAVKRVFGRLGL